MEDKQEQTAKQLFFLVILAFLLLFIDGCNSQSFEFQMAGGIAEVINVEQGASLYYSIGVGYTGRKNLGVFLGGSRAYFENQCQQDVYSALAIYKLIDGDVYDLVGVGGASYVREPFYLNNSHSDDDGYFTPTMGIRNLVAITDLASIVVLLEMNTAKTSTAYIGLGVNINLVFKTDKRAKRFY